MRTLRIDTINVSIDSKGRRTQEPSTLFGRSCCILTSESTHSPTVVQAISWKRASRGQRWHLEQCTNELEISQGGGKAVEIQKGAEGIGRKCRRQREILGEYFDGIMVGRCREHMIQICQKIIFIGFITHETK